MKQIIPILLCLALAGCYITSQQWERAETLCAANDGVSSIEMSGRVNCNNKASFAADAPPKLN
jgi:hypothetical protein